MIDGGLLIIVFSLAMLFTPRGQGTQAVRRPTTIVASAPLRSIYPPAMPTPQLTELVARADEALAQDSLTIGVRGLAATYDRP